MKIKTDLANSKFEQQNQKVIQAFLISCNQASTRKKNQQQKQTFMIQFNIRTNLEYNSTCLFFITINDYNLFFDNFLKLVLYYLH